MQIIFNSNESQYKIICLISNRKLLFYITVYLRNIATSLMIFKNAEQIFYLKQCNIILQSIFLSGWHKLCELIHKV